ncbi:UDP-N-acetylmuramoyl-L-alanine--D-glutamate ligase [Desulfogranum marinum]|uniref:UDP-N-acetylmuramoyl-L-alanine--D-glutamate ligase n=1 Tax=Desulfogranum marinum TaxID=453220 RepID=UPI001965E0FC|nr:UDP-N-acetylmuramoyl-L-alanine--D-glutamate ligase [Desulfogranum marinum]
MLLLPGMKGVVVGCGKAGLSAVRFLLDRDVCVGVSEGRTADQLDAALTADLQSKGVQFEFGGHTEEFLSSFDFVVPSPGIPLDLPVLHAVRQKGIKIVGELGLAAGLFQVPVIAVTGSNGKTTVTSLVGSLLAHAQQQVFVGGNIGTPLLEYFSSKEQSSVVVLELSSFQLDMAGAFRPDIGLVLNISPDHLDRHHTIDAYVDAKLKLVSHQRPGDRLILGGDDQRLAEITSVDNVDVYRFGTGKRFEAVVNGDAVELNFKENGVLRQETYNLQDTHLTSSVNRLNAAAAILAVRLAGCKREEVQGGLKVFEPPLHRMTEVAVIEGVRYINDSKATNYGAMHAALKGCTEPVVLIAGGREKGGDWQLLRDVVAQKVRRLILLGEAAEKMKQVFGDIVPVAIAESMDDAVQVARRCAQRGDLVLLAPGCASFDMYAGYEERGRVFMESVHRLQHEKKEKGVQ